MTLPLKMIGTTKQGDTVCHSNLMDLIVLDLPSPYNTIIDSYAQIEFHVRCSVRSLILVFST